MLEVSTPDLHSNFITVCQVHYLALHTYLNERTKTNSETLTPIWNPETMNPLDSVTDPSTHSNSIHTQYRTPAPILNTRSWPPMSDTFLKPAPPVPMWNHENPFAPCKEEYLKLYEEAKCYHHWTDGHLDDLTELHAQIPPLPAPLEVFTNREMITACVSDLQVHLSELCYLYSQGQAADACHKPPATSAARPPVILKTALLNVYNGTASQAKTFLAECHNFMVLNASDFPNNQLHIQWTLQLCSDQVATWKQIQLELMAEGTDVPHHLLHWHQETSDLSQKFDPLLSGQMSSNMSQEHKKFGQGSSYASATFILT